MGAPERVSVPRVWPGETVVCIGGGPSLTREDVEFCHGKARVIAVNDAYRLAPWADVLYAGDAKWWGWHKGVPGFPGLKYALERGAARWPGVQILDNTGVEGLEAAPTGVRTGRNSGFAAINVAVHLGAARIVLLGYDMMRGPKHQDGTPTLTPGVPKPPQPSVVEHWFGHHPVQGRSSYPAFIVKFASLVGPLQARGVEVINCSRVTALRCFPRRPLAEVLA